MVVEGDSTVTCHLEGAGDLSTMLGGVQAGLVKQDHIEIIEAGRKRAQAGGIFGDGEIGPLFPG